MALNTSQFWRLMADEFGDTQARIIADSLVLPTLHTTASQALDKGTDPRIVWLDICDLHGIPQARRLGKDLPSRTTRAMDL